jgi:cytochrome c553
MTFWADTFRTGPGPGNGGICLLSGMGLSLSKLAVAAGVAGLVLCGGYLSDASAQSRTVVNGSDELRTLYATPEDIAQGKVLAEQSCGGCHGINGISETAGIPNLAGQRAPYLFLELKAYKAGTRGDNPMNSQVKFLSDDALLKAAAYYASLDPADVPASNHEKAAADPVEAGKTAAAACAGCHGETGISVTPGMPSLAGLDPKYTVAAMHAYKSGQRDSELMKSMLASVTDQDMDNIALYYGLQKPARSQTPAVGDNAQGSAASAGCAGCHGSDGVSANSAFPSLAGQDPVYLASALSAYKQGTRKDETMKGLAAALDDGAIKNLAAFFTSQDPKQPDVRKPLTTEEWAQRCDRCHGVNGNSTDPRLPALAAQRADYLEKVLDDYRTGVRKSTRMAAMSDGLTDRDVAGLAAYYAHKKARAVVFLALPPRVSPRK